MVLYLCVSERRLGAAGVGARWIEAGDQDHPGEEIGEEREAEEDS